MPSAASWRRSDTLLPARYERLLRCQQSTLFRSRQRSLAPHAAGPSAPCLDQNSADSRSNGQGEIEEADVPSVSAEQELRGFGQ